jgi:hypothetical protein
MRHARSTITSVAALGAALLGGAPAAAHERGMSQLDLGVSGARVDAHAIFAADDPVDTAHWFQKMLLVAVDGAPCAVELGRTETNGGDREAWATYRCDEAPGLVTATLFELRPGERVVVGLHGGAELVQAVLTHDKRQVSLALARPSAPRRWPLVAAAAVAGALLVAALLRRRARAKSLDPRRDAP